MNVNLWDRPWLPGLRKGAFPSRRKISAEVMSRQVGDDLDGKITSQAGSIILFDNSKSSLLKAWVTEGFT